MKADKIIGAVQGVTKKWSKQRRREEREASAIFNRRIAMTRRHVSIKDAAWQVMEQAYMKASGGDKLPAHARQVMYAARGPIIDLADRSLGKDFDHYFTQQLLPNYIEENGCNWNVVFDARGHFREPHTGREIPLGTLQVGSYLHRIDKFTVEEPDYSNIREKRYPTLGPDNAYGGVLFIEKEGFFPLFEEVKLAERHDLAIMSTKGMSVTAARSLIDAIGTNHDIPIFVLHDFDKSGFSIVGTLQRDTRRYSFTGSADVIDLGIRLDDVNAEGLASEGVHYGKLSDAAVSANLSENGATGEEIEFLLRRRVELNAFASDRFIDWIERKLTEHGVKKVVPDDETLADAYRRMKQQAAVQKQVDKALKGLGKEKDGPVPADLRARIEAAQKATPDKRWDELLLLILSDKDNKEPTS
jgi:Topoisomerase 6 subunit A/Spo11, Toprim domain